MKFPRSVIGRAAHLQRGGVMGDRRLHRLGSRLKETIVQDYLDYLESLSEVEDSQDGKVLPSALL